jgi:23S rRNA (cytosine1962-C5)-methyltransferase
MAEAALAAPDLQFVQRLENPPEFVDCDSNSGLKALLFSYPPTATS